MPYAALRIRQAVEFRRASRHGGALSSPLTLYYSFLHLVRAFMALVSENHPTSGHGLKFVDTTQGGLLDAGATIARGTFSEYLMLLGVEIPPTTRLTLGECIAQVPEMAADFAAPFERESLAVPVEIAGPTIWLTTLRFFDGYLNAARFGQAWEAEFPSLAERCCLARHPLSLILKMGFQKLEVLREIQETLLEHDLEMKSASVFYALRHTPTTTVLPRPARYFMGLFILGSVVRYRPELLNEAVDAGSSLNWLVRRFLGKAERYFPQLLLSWVSGQTVYF